MLLTAFRLDRDRQTEQVRLGYHRSLWSGAAVMHRYTPQLGSPLETPDARPLALVLLKLVEYYPRRDPQTRADQSVVIERLVCQLGSMLYPYRIRYRRLGLDRGYRDDGLILLHNLNRIHQVVTKNEISFLSPLAYMFNTAHRPDRCDPYLYRTVDRLYHTNLQRIEGFAPQFGEWRIAEQLINLCDQGADPDVIETHFNTQLIPTLPFIDPITAVSWHAPIPLQHVMLERDRANPFDTCAPSALSIKHPQVTQYSPQHYHNLALQLDVLPWGTDLQLEYTLCAQQLKHQSVTQLIDRYGPSPYRSTPVDHLHLLRKIALLLAQDPLRPIVLDDAVITVQLTYGEEALIEVYNPQKTQCLAALHFDLAMLALTSANIVAEVSHF